MGAGSPLVATSMLTTAPAPTLAADEVHLWVFDVAQAPSDPAHRGVSGIRSPIGSDSYRRAAALAALASPGERERAARLRRPGDGARFLAARGALRQLLGGYLERDPHALRFEIGAWGKPSLADSDLCFNLSHSAALALIVVARGRQVGVDVERQRALSDVEGIVARVCTPRERDALDRVDPTEREGAFLALWTRKEALAKMTGMGMRAIERDASLDAYDDFRLEPLADLPGYAACVAAEGTEWRLVRPA